MIEPTGGINGMTIQQAILHALSGWKVRRLMWEDKEEYVAAGGDSLFIKDDGGIYDFKPNLCDYVSIDWIVIPNSKETDE